MPRETAEAKTGARTTADAQPRDRNDQQAHNQGDPLIKSRKRDGTQTLKGIWSYRLS